MSRRSTSSAERPVKFEAVRHLRSVVRAQTGHVVAKRIGVSQQAVSQWTREEYQPRARYMLRLQDEYGIPMRDWMQPTTPANQQTEKRRRRPRA